MPVELSVEGVGLRDLKRKVKELDDKKLMRDINDALKEAARPLLGKAAAAARTSLPQRGGLAASVGRASFKVSVTQRGVRIVAKGSGVGGSNRGTISHPVFGNRDRWVKQPVKPGWFDDEMTASAPDVKPDVVAVIERFAERVADA